MYRFKVEKMECGGCARTVTRAVQAVEPDAGVEIDLGTRLVTVSGASGSADRIARALGEAGYPARSA